MDLFTPHPRTARAYTAQVRAWAAQLLLGVGEPPHEATVMVTELACVEPGCPPVETVIALLAPGRPAEVHRLHVPIAEVTRADIEALAAPAGGPAPSRAAHDAIGPR